MQINSRVLRIKEVINRVGLSRSTIYLLEKQGKFPKRISLSVRAVGWKETDIEYFIAERGYKSANDSIYGNS